MCLPIRVVMGEDEREERTVQVGSPRGEVIAREFPIFSHWLLVSMSRSAVSARTTVRTARTMTTVDCQETGRGKGSRCTSTAWAGTGSVSGDGKAKTSAQGLAKLCSVLVAVTEIKVHGGVLHDAGYGSGQGQVKLGRRMELTIHDLTGDFQPVSPETQADRSVAHNTSRPGRRYRCGCPHALHAPALEPYSAGCPG